MVLCSMHLDPQIDGGMGNFTVQLRRLDATIEFEMCLWVRRLSAVGVEIAPEEKHLNRMIWP